MGNRRRKYRVALLFFSIGFCVWTILAYMTGDQRLVRGMAYGAFTGLGMAAAWLFASN